MPEVTSGVVRDIRRMRSRLRELLAESETDPLTGCRTRRFLDSYLDGAGHRRCAALMCDLDHFNQINDNHGHAAGDRMLAAFGRCLLANVRETDVCVRYGGEEFAVLLPGSSRDAAVGVAEKIRAAWRESRVETDAGALSGTVSIGVAGPGPDGLKRADAALYEAKRAGRDRVALCPDDREDSPDQAGEEPAAPSPGPRRLMAPAAKERPAGNSQERTDAGSARPEAPLIRRARPRGGGRGADCLVFGAPRAGCGASTVALAAARALAGRFEVVLVDCDFRHPALGPRLGLPAR